MPFWLLYSKHYCNSEVRMVAQMMEQQVKSQMWGPRPLQLYAYGLKWFRYYGREMLSAETGSTMDSMWICFVTMCHSIRLIISSFVMMTVSNCLIIRLSVTIIYIYERVASSFAEFSHHVSLEGDNSLHEVAAIILEISACSLFDRFCRWPSWTPSKQFISPEHIKCNDDSSFYFPTCTVVSCAEGDCCG